MRHSLFFKLSLAATSLAFVVIVLGAYVRLSDAGLGCPDWPGCYGHMSVPQSSDELTHAQSNFPHQPVEAHKAWKEMVHRYFAGTLGLLILVLAILAVRHRRDRGQQRVLPLALVGVVIFQGLLGMWTVTIKLNPTIVMLHLLGGLTTLSLLWWMTLRQGQLFSRQIHDERLKRLRVAAVLGLLLVVLQIFLGGWTSANYAALHCPDFPTCQQQWWPTMNFSEAFTLWRGTELNFEGGVLDNDARVTIHVMHRLMALLVLVGIGTLALWLILKPASRSLRALGMVMLSLLFLQVSLGISNVLFSLPLPVAVAHNGGAALLLLSLVTLNHLLHVRAQARPSAKGAVG